MLTSIFTQNYGPQEKVLIATALVLSAVIAIIIHELAHGYAALSQGDPTAKMAGRLTLNPVAHFNLLGFLMMMTVGIGWARPVPINPYNFKKYKKGCFIVSIAGVLANFILVLITAILYVLFIKFVVGTINYAPVITFFDYFFNYSILLNVSLMLFNLLPIYPLDGFRIIESFTKPNNKFCIFMRTNGIKIFLGLFLFSFIIDLLGLRQLDILGNLINLIYNAINNLINWIISII